MGKKKGCFSPCVDLNDLTAITPKPTLGDNSCSFGRAFQLTAAYPEKTFAAQGVSLPCRWGGGACGCTAVSEERARYYAMRKILLPVQGRIHGFAIDLALSSPAVVVYWPLTSPLCGGDTCRVLTASWQTRFLNSWLDGGPPNKTHRSAHMLSKGVRAVCVYVTVYLPPVRPCHWTHLWCVCAATCVFVCAHFPSTDEN